MSSFHLYCHFIWHFGLPAYLFKNPSAYNMYLFNLRIANLILREIKINPHKDISLHINTASTDIEQSQVIGKALIITEFTYSKQCKQQQQFTVKFEDVINSLNMFNNCDYWIALHTHQCVDVRYCARNRLLCQNAVTTDHHRHTCNSEQHELFVLTSSTRPFVCTRTVVYKNKNKNNFILHRI